MSPRLDVIVVSWNVRELLRACLTSLLDDLARVNGLDARVTVVDSASADGSAGLVRAEFPNVALHASDTNLGYVKANNLVLNAALSAPERDDHYAWLLNPDTVVRTGAAAALLGFMQAAPRCAICGPQLRNPNDTLQHGAFKLPGLAQLLIDTQPRLARFRNTVWDGRYDESAYARGVPFRIGAPLGAAMWVRMAAVRRVGALDEGFEMYSEEIDWAARMAEAGWEAWCVPAARVTHYGGASSGQASERTERIKWASRQRYYSKHYGPFKRWLANRLVPAQFRI